jgi:hypothetical protein
LTELRPAEFATEGEAMNRKQIESLRTDAALPPRDDLEEAEEKPQLPQPPRPPREYRGDIYIIIAAGIIVYLWYLMF